MIHKIILVRPRGFCAGVDRAIDVVETSLEIFGSPVYVKHAIVHNVHVVADLEKKGAKFIEKLDDVPAKSMLVFSAHGTGPAIKEEAKKRGHRVIDATCPLVTKVHLEAQRYAKEGYFIIYIGHKGHPEPEGVFGEVPKDSAVLIEDTYEVKNLKVPQKDKLVCLTQTTLSIPDTKSTIKALQKKFKNLILPPSFDICYATTNRQGSARELAKKSDLVLVVGSQTSSNSKRLVEVCKEEGVKAYLIDDKTKINPIWLKGVKNLGITSGASVPEYLVDDLTTYFKKKNSQLKVERIEVMKEEIKFPLPDDLVLMAKQSAKGAAWVTKHKVVTQR